MKINSRMALVFLAVLPILAIGMGILMKVVDPVFERAFKIYDRMNSAKTSMTGQRTAMRVHI